MGARRLASSFSFLSGRPCFAYRGTDLSGQLGASSRGATPTQALDIMLGNGLLGSHRCPVVSADRRLMPVRTVRNGVVDVGHLQVLPLEALGGGVRILAGGAILAGAGIPGSYFAYNVGDATVDISPRGRVAAARHGSSGGTNIDGTPWSHDVTTDPVYTPVIEGVSSRRPNRPQG